MLDKIFEDKVIFGALKVISVALACILCVRALSALLAFILAPFNI